jgi:predicted transcriptional regulator
VDENARQLAAQIVSAYITRTAVAGTELHGLITAVYGALSDAEKNLPATGPGSHSQTPAVDPKRSVFKDHIVCLEDGKKFKMLKRHLHTDHSMTPAEYREKWGLPGSYPMVAAGYAAERSKIAKTIGLGTTSHGRGKQKKGKR